MKHKKMALISLLAALLFSACTIQVNTNINADGSGQLITEIGLTAEDEAMMASFDMSTEEFCQDPEIASDLPDGAAVEIETRGEETWCVYSIPFADLNDLKTQYSDGLTVNRLELVDDVLYYDVTADLSSQGMGDAEDAGIEVTILWKLTLPGSLGEHNADSISGRTLTWDLSNSTQSVNMRAQSDLGGALGGLGGLSVYLYVALCCLCLLVLLGGGAGVFFIVRRRNAEQDEGL